VLIDWISDVLVRERIIVKDLVEDLYDGQVLQKLFAVYAKNIVAILHLLVALYQHFRAPIRLPDHVSIQVVVVQTLITFVNKHLNKLNLEVSELETQVHNVLFSFELMQDGNLEKAKPRPEDIVNCDLKSTLRVLYNLFTKYRNVE
ncbi:hypothetical protein cypCar_00041210, partial [Cyprinus carpio]